MVAMVRHKLTTLDPKAREISVNTFHRSRITFCEAWITRNWPSRIRLCEALRLGQLRVTQAIVAEKCGVASHFCY